LLFEPLILDCVLEHANTNLPQRLCAYKNNNNWCQSTMVLAATPSNVREKTAPPRPYTIANNTRALPDADELRVNGLENVEPSYGEFDGRMYGGTLPSNHNDRVGEMMFWLFEPTTQEVENTIVIWLNGGPGCSSFNCGVMMEHSPVTQPLHDAGYCCLKATPDLYVNEHAWTKATTMLYVEQPIGTGFSYGSPLPEDEDDAASDLYAFMQNFYQVFPKFASYNFYIMGESYAGMFVPSFARYFHIMNKLHDGNHDYIHIPIKGASLGNGWMDPSVQGPATIDYSWWHGLIDEPTRNALHNEWYNCYELAQPGPGPFHSLSVQDDCGIMWGILLAAGNPNAYDVTTWDPNVDQITFTSEAFYNRDDVKASLHAPTNITWHGCRGFGRRRRRLLAMAERRRHSRQLSEVTESNRIEVVVDEGLDVDDLPSYHQNQRHRKLYMDNDRPWSVVPYVADLVDEGIPVLIYNGDRDMTTNMVGTELLLNRMAWSGASNWTDAPRGTWIVPTTNYQGGWAKEYGALTFLVVYNSGHMVPYNQPKPSYDLLLRFLRGESFVDFPAPNIRIEKLSTNTSGMGTPAKDALRANLFSENLSGALMSHAPVAFEANVANDGGVYGHLALLSTAFVSMMIGALLTLYFVGSQRKRYRRHVYETIPNNTSGDE
jgi:carboxypeptidase C (cathepsin A)